LWGMITVEGRYIIAVACRLDIVADRTEHHILIVDLTIQDHHVDLYIHIIIIHIDRPVTMVIDIIGIITMAIADVDNK